MNKGSNQEFIDGTQAQTTVVVPFLVLSCVLMNFTAVKTLSWLLRRFLFFYVATKMGPRGSWPHRMPQRQQFPTDSWASCGPQFLQSVAPSSTSSKKDN
ncbi:hypothetical protein Ae201684P_013221 [Aphanomyces euteiches]|nr:hypothetical protein Ae201684P_013221 [Aphanomyces euteiches]